VHEAEFVSSLASIASSPELASPIRTFDIWSQGVVHKDDARQHRHPPIDATFG
jgi:hypothetical protein